MAAEIVRDLDHSILGEGALGDRRLVEGAVDLRELRRVHAVASPGTASLRAPS
jgi:hypothetical protein